jgi:hypothetical protein
MAQRIFFLAKFCDVRPDQFKIRIHCNTTDAGNVGDLRSSEVLAKKFKQFPYFPFGKMGTFQVSVFHGSWVV